MFRSLILAAVLLAAAPLVANAGEITLLPSIKLQIGDRDNYGNYWDGGSWRDRDYWRRHYEWRDNRWHRHDNGWHKGWYKGRDKARSAAIAPAGATATIAAAAGDVVPAGVVTVMDMAITNRRKGSPSAPLRFIPHQEAINPPRAAIPQLTSRSGSPQSRLSPSRCLSPSGYSPVSH